MKTLELSSKPTIAGLPWKVAANLLAVYVIWGSTYLAIRIAVADLPPFLLSGSRFIVAGGILLAILRWRGEPLPTRRQWLSAAMVGGLLLGGGNGGVVFAEQWVSSSLAAAIVATSPLWVALFSGLFGQWPQRREWFGIALGIAGVVLLNTSGELRANPLGAIVILIAPISWALGSVLSRRVNLPNGMMATAAEMLTGGILLMGASLLRGETLGAAIAPQAVAAWVYLILFGSLVGFSAFMYLIRNVRPALATSYAYVNPVVALGLGVALAGEKISGLELAAIGITLAGVVLIVLVRERRTA
jgi:drug/metabolite transporter (DMT)-like permease